jgi:hypothetical protein
MEVGLQSLSSVLELRALGEKNVAGPDGVGVLQSSGA